MSGASVECYSGHTYAQEPRAVMWHGQRHQVTQVDERWRTPDGPAFLVQTEPGITFTLHYLEHQDRWTITAVPAIDEPIVKNTEVPNQDEKLCSQNH